MTTRKNIITACFAALLALSLVACGGSSSRPADPPAQLHPLEVAREAAKTAAEAARMAYDAAMAALTAVEANKADGMASYDAAKAKVDEARAAYEAARMAAAEADMATTSAEARRQQEIAERKRDEARAAEDEAVRLAGMVTDSHGDAERLRMALSTAQTAARTAAAEAMSARDAAQRAVDALEDKKDDDLPNYTRAMEQLALAGAAYTKAKAASDAAARAMVTADGVAEAERQRGIAEAEQAKARAANREAMRFAALVNAAVARRLTPGDGLVRSTVPPLFHDEGIDDDDRGPLVTVPTVASGIRRDYDEGRSGLANDAYVKSLGFANVADDDGIPFSLHVTYVIGGEEVTVRFTDADRDTPGYDLSWTKTVDGVEYWGWLYEGDEAQDDTISFLSGLPGYRLYSTGGIRTATADLPSGTAVYVGGMRGDTHLRNDPSLSGRESMSGNLRLTANFDTASLEGRISDIRVRPEPPRSRVWSSLPDTTWFTIDSGRIVDGQFTAHLTGMDSNANAAMNETVRGYEGNVLGEFYGPGAKEVGGVLNASRDDRVMAGAFGGTHPDAVLPPDAAPPTGLHRNMADPVYASSASDTFEDVINQGTRFSPLTSALRSDHVEVNTALDDDTYVEQVWIEGDFDNGGSYNIAYVVHGQEQIAEFEAADYDPQNEFEKEIEGGGQWLWSVTGRFCCDSGYSYLDVFGFGHWTEGVSYRTYTTVGVRTDPANMPTGRATYAGGIRADAYKQDNPSSDFRYRVSGDLNLTADFDDGTLDGNVSGIRTRPQGESSWSPLSETTSFEIGNGQIAGGQFTADLTGADTNSGAALDDSLRGYEGNVLGEFYGPAAEEVGGVFTATRDADQRVLYGALHGRKQQGD